MKGNRSALYRATFGGLCWYFEGIHELPTNKLPVNRPPSAAVLSAPIWRRLRAVPAHTAGLSGGVRAVTRGAGLSGRLRALPPGLPPQRQTADGADSGTRTSPTSPRGPEGGWGPIRESSSAHKCPENSSFLVPGQRTQDEERAPRAASRPAATKRELWRQYLTEAGGDELADNEQHRAVFGAAGVRASGGSSSPLGAAPEMPGTAQAGPASGPSSRRPSRPGPRRHVPLRGSPACPPLPVALLGGRPPSFPPARRHPSRRSPARPPSSGSPLPGRQEPTSGTAPSAPRPAPSEPEPLASGPFFPPPPGPV